MRWIGQITYDEIAYFREDVIIEAGNKLGIGTTSPSQALDVFGNIKMQNNDALMSENVAGGTRSLIALGSDNSKPSFLTSSLNRVLSGSIKARFIFAGKPPTL